WRGELRKTADAVVVFGASIAGALIFAWSDTFWFNAVEAEVYASAMFFIALVLWLVLRWHEVADEPYSQRYLLLVAFVIGLSIGVHQLSLLVYFGIVLVIYFRLFTFRLGSFVLFGLGALAFFIIIYSGIITWLPSLLDGKLTESSQSSILVQLIPVLIVLVMIGGLWYSHKIKHGALNTVILSAFLIIIGYSTYTLVLIRAMEHPPINENNPDTLERLVMYLNREQYGDMPSITDRRWSNEPEKIENYRKYKSDWDYFVSYQLNHMFLRYLYWQYIGRAGDIQDAPSYFAGEISDGPENGSWTLARAAFPNVYYGIPFLLGLIGLFYHFRKDWKMASMLLVLFLVFGVALVIYFNMAEPQARERDYFFVGAFFVFAMWAGFGTAAILEFLERRITSVPFLGVTLAVLLVAAPVNMARENWFDHDRSHDYIPWDISYNTLQSCEPNAILFTNGDNDTFPLWYLQEVEGIRQDVRIVCLSLLNTDWYTLQLKNESPHGTEPVSISFSDEEIKRYSAPTTAEDFMQTTWPKEERELSLIVPGVVMQRFIAENAVGNESEPDASRFNRDFKMVWKSKARYPVDIGGGQYVYKRAWQDVVVEDILRKNSWDRPIYFAVSVSPQSFIGLDKYLRMEGLAFRVTPIEERSGDYIYFKAMWEHLFADDVVPSRNYKRGFLFRSLQRPDVYLDNDAQRMCVNYRNAFLRTALYTYHVLEDKQKTIQVLNRMEEILPHDVIPMDYRLQYNIATLYLDSGDSQHYEALAREIEARCWVEIAKNPREVRSYSSPYRFLLEMYRQRKDYKKAVALVDSMLKYFPNAEDIQALRSSLIEELERTNGKTTR
ncbi:MAG: DUF2723 domain-containing protein, partial [Chlorobi bacterium]|nr:DUF2723 domain-containing protein [Chlorobiota bacterium]